MVAPAPASPPADVQRELGVTVTHFLGGGAFRQVFEAIVSDTGEVVALVSEALGHEQQIDYAVMQRTKSEPLHPHVVGPPPGLGQTSQLIHHGRCYTVLQRLQQEAFDLLADNGGALQEAAARTYFLQMAAGLRFLHRLGIGHRDLKLENMMLAQDGTLKLIDFGLAHVAPVPNPLYAPWEMRAVGYVGTRSYCAPEVALNNGMLYDACKADVWSLGCTLFALVTGIFIVDVAKMDDPRFRRLVQTQNGGDSGVRAIFGLYNRPCPLSDALVALLDGMLTVEPDARFDMEQVVNAAWMTQGYAPFLAREDSYRTDLLNRRRASQRWARLTTASMGFGRALVTLGGVLDGVRNPNAQPGRADGMDMDDVLEPPSRGSSWVAPIPAFFRSLSGMSDDEMGPPVMRSGGGLGLGLGDEPSSPSSPSRGFSAMLGDTFRGLSESVVGVQPPPVVKQRAQRM